MKQLVLPNGKKPKNCFIDVNGKIYREIEGNLKELNTWFDYNTKRFSIPKDDPSFHSSYRVDECLLATFKKEFPAKNKIIYYIDSDTNNVSMSNIQYMTRADLYRIKRSNYFDLVNDDCYVLKNGNPEELWKIVNIDGADTHYMISNLGQIYSVLNGIILKQVTSDRYNFMAYRDHDINGNQINKRFSTHALVARYFVKNPYPEYFIWVDHKDGNKKNNRADNLQWVTPKQNILNAKYLGLLPKGESHANSKHTEAEVRKICELIEQGVREKDIMKQLGIERNIITRIKKREAWVWVSKEYDIDKNRYQHYVSPIRKAAIAHLLKSGYIIDEVTEFLKIGRTTIGLVSKERNDPKYDIYPEEDVMKALVLFMYEKDNPIKTIKKVTGLPKDEIVNIIYEETNRRKVRSVQRLSKGETE